VSEFKGTLYVHVREVYVKDGKELPGGKGLTMSGDQWHALAGMLDALHARVAA